MSGASLALADENPPAAPVSSEGLSDQASEGPVLEDAAGEESPPPADAQAAESLPLPTDVQAAESLPHVALDGIEAAELLDGVFGEFLEDQAQLPAEDADITRYTSNYSALLASPQQPDGASEEAEDQVPTLLESTLPLRTRNDENQLEPVDLSFEQSEGELQAVNPLVEIGVPSTLGEGIELPEVGITINPAGDPEGQSEVSTIGDSVAFYPNVRQDTDFAVTLIPTGVETLTQIRSADAPESQTYHLDIPVGAELRGSPAGGAEVVDGSGRALLGIPPAFSIDASGAEVPTTMEVTDHTLVVTIAPDESTIWPVLVDPLFQTYGGSVAFNPGSAQEGWESERYSATNAFTLYNGGTLGLTIYSTGSALTGDHSNWKWTVPRYWDSPKPTTYISRAVLGNLTWGPNYQKRESPFLYAGIRSPVNWVSYIHPRGGYGYGLPAHTYEFLNPEPNYGVKELNIGMYAQENLTMGENQGVVSVESATIELSEPLGVAPSFGKLNGPEQWMDSTALPIDFAVSDSGLGVSAIYLAGKPGTSPPFWETKRGCTGLALSPCPREWKSQNGPPIQYNPAALPQGINNLLIEAEDPLGRRSAPATVQVYIDHTAPQLSLSGTLTEQAQVGTGQERYAVSLAASDGSAGSPQSGISTLTVYVDGKEVAARTPKCTTENCAANLELILNPSFYAPGQHKLEAIAVDAVGRSTTRTVNFELTRIPKISLSGTATEVGSSVSRFLNTYNLRTTVEGEANTTGTLQSVGTYGAPGSGNGQFAKPTGIAETADGFFWVADTENNRIEQLNGSGSYLRQAGSQGSGPGQLSHPSGVAVAPSGNVWVADTGNDRIVKFGWLGEFILSAGESGAGALSAPRGIAVDSEGNVWVADTGNDRIVKFDSAGKIVSTFGTEGGGAGQLRDPSGLFIGLSGNIWVADTGNDRIEKFSKTGTYLAQFGSSGTANGQLLKPLGVAEAPSGTVWVADTGNGRVQEFSGTGEFITQLGNSAGDGLKMAEPASLVARGTGEILVTDRSVGRIFKRVEPGNQPQQKTELFLDGAPVGSASSATCTKVSNCWSAPEWAPSIGTAGKHILLVRATDAAGNVSTKSTSFERLTDLTAPTLSLSGSLTEVATVGSKRPSYSLTMEAMDGTASQPQSGVASLKLKRIVGGGSNPIIQASPGCLVENCSITREWTLESGDYPSGELTFEVIAADARNNETTRRITVILNPEPKITLQGSMTEQWQFGPTLPAYGLAVGAEAQVPEGEGPWAMKSVVGSLGTADGQLRRQVGIATNSSGRIFVADTENSRIETFSESGGFLSKFGVEGTAAGQLKKPRAVAVDPSGNIWVADTGNNRVQKFSSTGTYLAAFGTLGSANGQLSVPSGIAIAPNGDILVADTGNNRVQEFTTAGVFVRKIGSAGTGNGQLNAPRAVAVTAAGNIWVADSGNSRLEEFGPTGTYLRKIEGAFSAPKAIYAGPRGTLWITDTTSVFAYREDGTLMSQFGVKGVGSGQMLMPEGIAGMPDGTILVSDSGNSRIERWSSGTRSIAYEISVDGKSVDSREGPCSIAKCLLSWSWTLASSEYAPGIHTVSVKATDSMGDTAYKKVQLEIKRDTTSPALEASGALIAAPSGWVEQDQYGLTAKATDQKGYGVTSLKFAIDGQAVAESTQLCSWGGCGTTLSRQVDMSAYPGGAHEAALIATDGAGNRTTKSWTINVDPEGHVSPGEATDVLEAVEDTSESTVVAPPREILDPEQLEGGDNPHLRQNGNDIASYGVPAKTTTTTNPGSGITVEGEDGPITIVPTVIGENSSLSLVEKVASVTANAGNSVDTVIRPQYNGLQTFQSIRDPSSPDSFSWQVQLGKRQSLKLIGPEWAEVVYEDSTVAFLITSEKAQDATGATVPTNLEVNGNVLTLKVNHRSSQFVYPVVAATEWETSYVVPIEVELPENEMEIWERERREKEAREQALSEGFEGAGRELEDEALNASEPMSSAEIAEGREFLFSSPPAHRDPDKLVPLKQARHILRKHVLRRTIPAPRVNLIGGPGGNGSGGAEKIIDVNGHACSSLVCDIWNVDFADETDVALVRTGSKSGHREYATPHGGAHCGSDVNFWWSFNLEVDAVSAGTRGPNVVDKGSREHLTFWCKFHLFIFYVPLPDEVGTIDEDSVLINRVYANGFQEIFTQHWNTWILEG